jgi:hypothetical protein
MEGGSRGKKREGGADVGGGFQKVLVQVKIIFEVVL